MRGPRLLRFGAGALERRAFLIPWDEVEEHDDRLVTRHRRADVPRLGNTYPG